MAHRLIGADPLQPTVVFIDNPFGHALLPALPVQIGGKLSDTKPADFGSVRFPVMLRVSGEWLLQVDWDTPVLPGDKIEWHVCLPQGGNVSRTILQIVAFIAIAYFTAGIGNVYIQAAARIALGLAATALINAIVPASKPAAGGNVASPGSVYNVQVAGNQARLNAPIPVLYGRNLTFPDFACQPYSEYTGNNQFYSLIVCIGQGDFVIERLQIDDTPFSAFTDVWYQVLTPGMKPTRVLPNVVTAPEVVDQDLKSLIYVGGFAASGPQTIATHIGVDFEFPQGLAHINNDGNPENKTVTLAVQIQPIDDFGTPTAEWGVLGSFSYTNATITPQRISRKYILPVAGRVQVRVKRMTTFDDNSRELNACHWTGLRAYLQYNVADVLEPTATHLEVRIRANEQLSQFTQRKIGVISIRKLRTWTPDDGWSVETFSTRSIGLALADMWSDANYGSGLDDTRIDLQTIYDLNQIWTQRQDRLDIVFDSKITAWDGAKTICQAGRATPFRRYGVCTLARDQNQDIAIAGFSSRNIRPNSVSIGYALATEITADAVVVEYFSNRIWDWVQIECLAPGVVTPTNRVISRIAGITGSKQALREGTYMAAVNMYRRKFCSWETEMQGLLPCFGDLVLFAPVLAQWAAVGDVVSYDVSTRTVLLTEPVSFAGGQHAIRFQRENGKLTGPVTAHPGATEYEVLLDEYPDFDVDFVFNTEAAGRERARFVFGPDVEVRSSVKLLSISKRERDENNVQYIQISSVNEDVRVHTADFPFLPGPGEIQDPVPEPDGVPSGGGAVPLALLRSHTIQAFGTDEAISPYPQPSIGFTLGTDGRFSWEEHDSFSRVVPYPPTFPDRTGSYAGEWNTEEIDAGIAITYEARLTGTAPVGFDWTGPAFDEWVDLGTDRTWSFTSTSYKSSLGDFVRFSLNNAVEMQIRHGGLIQASCVLQLNLWDSLSLYETPPNPGDNPGLGGDAGDSDSGGDAGDAGDSDSGGSSSDGSADSGDGGDGGGGDGGGGE